MRKVEFKNIIKDGINRNKNFMAVKMRCEKDVNPRVVIIQGEDITPTRERYLRATDDDMIFKDTGDKIEDVLLTNNLNDLSWFVY